MTSILLKNTLQEKDHTRPDESARATAALNRTMAVPCQSFRCLHCRRKATAACSEHTLIMTNSNNCSGKLFISADHGFAHLPTSRPVQKHDNMQQEESFQGIPSTRTGLIVNNGGPESWSSTSEPPSRSVPSLELSSFRERKNCHEVRHTQSTLLHASSKPTQRHMAAYPTTSEDDSVSPITVARQQGTTASKPVLSGLEEHEAPLAFSLASCLRKSPGLVEGCAVHVIFCAVARRLGAVTPTSCQWVAHL